MSPLSRKGSVTAPILLHHAGRDEYAPVQQMHALADRFCSHGVPVEVAVVPGLTHFGYAPSSAGPAFDYLADRFAAQPVPNRCRSGSVGPTTGSDGAT
jgi:acetyl esterase/lipase